MKRLHLTIRTGPSNNSTHDLISPDEFSFEEDCSPGSEHEYVRVSDHWLITFTVDSVNKTSGNEYEVRIKPETLLITSTRCVNVPAWNWINRRVVTNMKKDLLDLDWEMTDSAPHPESDFVPHRLQRCPS